MKHRFEMMLEYELADYASDYLNGSYCGAHSRVSDDCALDPRKAEINSYGEYFFEDSVRHLLPDVAFAAMTNFKCPEIIRQIANDRSEPYEQYSLKRGRQMMRYMDKWSAHKDTLLSPLGERPGEGLESTLHAPVYKYEYMTKDYCLGSMQGGIVQPIQQQSWSLVFNSDKPHNIITGLHPYVSDEELGMFFPEYPSFMLERIGSTKASYTSENKWEGGSPYERIYQDKNVLVALYDLPDSEKYHHVDIYIPLNAIPLIENTPRIGKNDQSIDSKWIPAGEDRLGGWKAYQFDSTLIGIWTYSKCKQISEPNGTRLQEYDSLAEQQAVPLYLVYCRSIREITPNLFVKSLSNTSIRWKDNMVYSYSDNDSIHIAIDENRSVKTWLFHSPYLESKKGGGALTMRYKGEERELDFNK